MYKRNKSIPFHQNWLVPNNCIEILHKKQITLHCNDKCNTDKIMSWYIIPMFNSLWLKWRQRSGSTLALAEAWSWRHQAIALTGVDLPSVSSNYIHPRVISQTIHRPVITKIYLKIIDLNFHSNLSRDNALIYGLFCQCYPMNTTGPRLNIKDRLSRYGDSHVKNKTAGRTSYL